LIARKVHIASVAIPGRRFNVSKSFIARIPNGVAAFANPRKFAAMFISIEPIAGCWGGTSGNSHRITGRMTRAIVWINPAFSASRMTPSQSDMIPASGSAIFITAVSAIVKAPSVNSFKVPDDAPSRL
jgi:hypothetical protein